METKDGLHIWEDHFYPEVIDSTSGAAAAEGKRGELVFTSLTKQAMPLIRYRTRDLTRLLPGTARPAFRRMERQLLLTRASRLDHLTVLAEARTKTTPELRAASAARVVHAIRESIGVTIEVRVLDPGSLERSTGKLRRVLDQRQDQSR